MGEQVKSSPSCAFRRTALLFCFNKLASEHGGGDGVRFKELYTSRNGRKLLFPFSLRHGLNSSAPAKLNKIKGIAWWQLAFRLARGDLEGLMGFSGDKPEPPHPIRVASRFRTSLTISSHVQGYAR